MYCGLVKANLCSSLDTYKDTDGAFWSYSAFISTIFVHQTDKTAPLETMGGGGRDYSKANSSNETFIGHKEDFSIMAGLVEERLCEQKSFTTRPYVAYCPNRYHT